MLESVLEQDIASILRERIFTPLGISASLADIRTTDRHKLAIGYTPYYDDRPLPPGGLLTPATWFESNSADGSISSTPEDMCRYLRLLLKQGKGLLAPDSFGEFIKPVISTDDGLHGEQYALGLFTRQIDGHHIIGHSGGMVGYTADMLANLDTGLGVIVLANGPSDPMKISRYALSLLRAALDGKELPDFHEDKVEYADDYGGEYLCGEKTFTLTVKDQRLYLDFKTATVPLTQFKSDRFIIPHPAFEMFNLCMGRENEKVTEACWGEERYVRVGFGNETIRAHPPEWEAYPGHYQSHNPWFSNFRIVLCNGALVYIDQMGDDEPLHQLEPGLFRLGDDPRSPEFIRFELVVDGKAMRAIVSGSNYSRMFTP